MKLLNSIVFATVVLTKNIRTLGDEISGYKTVEISWEVEATPGGPTMILNGTVEEVHAQLLEVNPNYDSDFAEIKAAKKAAAAARQFTGLSNREASNICDLYGVWDSATKARILEGVDYLHGVKGQPVNGPGPGNCGRVSCSYDSAIWWCNDNPTTKALPSFDPIADAAAIIVTDCPEMDTEVLGVRTISGQRFQDDLWNCIVRGAHC
ncbi:hypothetical protein QBC44DRAFT_338278 [Cladorrhinum sp. PSN332]|nr:hypothetical protein QBC44DRAFT_338278 [Cladorrhinum sp. PSN332]